MGLEQPGNSSESEREKEIEAAAETFAAGLDGLILAIGEHPRLGEILKKGILFLSEPGRRSVTRACEEVKEDSPD